MGSTTPLRILAVAPVYYEADNVNDFIFSLRAHSRHRLYYLFDAERLIDIDLSAWDVVVLLFTVDLRGEDVSPAARERLRKARALKVAFLQDEHYRIHALTTRLAEIGAGVLFTCVPEAHHQTFFPSASIPTLRAIHTTLPGYVPSRLERRRPAGRHRPVDVAYRGRRMPYALGDLSREKQRIGEVFDSFCRERGLRADISTLEHDRIYGPAWLRFLERARCVLGTPSGVSVVDFDGSIRQRSDLYQVTHPDASYEDVRRECFGEADGRVVTDTASSRMFEAAACGTTMVQLEGEYGGVLEPGRHYIPVMRDYSNLDDVAAQIRDRAFCDGLAAQSHRDLIASGRFSYRTFVRRVDEILEANATASTTAAPPSAAAFYARAYRWRGPAFVPFGGSFAALPTASTPLGWLARVLRAVPRLGHRPAVYRFARNPYQMMCVFHSTSEILRSRAVIRSILRRVWTDPDLRAAVPALRLVEDLVKFEVLRCASASETAAEPFAVDVSTDGPRTLVFTSRAGRSMAGGVTRPAAELLDRGAAAIVWNHSAISTAVVWEPRPGRRTLVGIGTSGVYWFEALSALSLRAPHIIAPLLCEVAGTHRAAATVA